MVITCRYCCVGRLDFDHVHEQRHHHPQRLHRNEIHGILAASLIKSNIVSDRLEMVCL
jgi:hypothetical protein